MKNFFMTLGKKLSQVFEDQTGAIDDKRIAGVALIAAGLYYVESHAPSMEVLAIFSAHITFGLACFGLSIPSDKIGMTASSLMGGNNETGNMTTPSGP